MQESYFQIGSTNARMQVDLMMSEFVTEQKQRLKINTQILLQTRKNLTKQ